MFLHNCEVTRYSMASTTISSKMRGDVISLLLIWWCLVALAAAQCHPERCGSMDVSYPFWIQNRSCGYHGFQIKCKAKPNSTGDHAPFLPTPGGDMEILNINYMGYLIINSTSLKAEACDDDAAVVFKLPEDGPFTISSFNRLAVIGCYSKGSFKDEMDPIQLRVQQSMVMPDLPKRPGVLERVGGLCQSTCLGQSDIQYCNSFDCCELPIPANIKWINFTGGGIENADTLGASCGFSTLLDPSTFSITKKEKKKFGRGRYGLRLDWDVDHLNCSMAKKTHNYSCGEKARCRNSLTGQGYVCSCLPGYEGTGYRNGTACTDIDECKGENQCVDPPKGICHNLRGNYTCSCSKGYVGDGFRNSTGCNPVNSNIDVIPAIIASVSSVIGVSLAAALLFWWLKKRDEKVVKANYFQQNGGVQLQKYIASRGGRENIRIYSATELEKASKKYSMELGSGGYSTVYKGILDGTTVAIKKSKKSKEISDVAIKMSKKSKVISDPQEDDESINELIILSQINHRNVVKLRGCCLETQFPTLVYEFVPNGTLSQRLQSGEESLDWESRLRVAIETAEALAYLHSAASQPIFHRDVKSSNILLDKTFTPKVADFGISRLLSVEGTHVTTALIGTRSYLDPEYYQSGKLTAKSDVYSFGVVLLELLTGLEPLSLKKPEDPCLLSALFLSEFADNRLSAILDPNVRNEENRVQMENMARLARECLEVEGKRRPSMKEVVQKLVSIRGSSSDEKYRGRDDNQTSMETADLIGASQNKNIERNYSYPVTCKASSIEFVRISTI